MKLRNKKTGEIGKLHCDMNISPAKYDVFEDTDIRGQYWEYDSLAELNEEWEDYEEPKKHYEILAMGAVMEREDAEDEIFRNQGQREIGNYFETKEEAEKAVEKLEAWKLLKDMGFKIEGIRYRNHKNYIEWSISQKVRDDHFTAEGFNSALHLIFGGEE